MLADVKSAIELMQFLMLSRMFYESRVACMSPELNLKSTLAVIVIIIH